MFQLVNNQNGHNFEVPESYEPTASETFYEGEVLKLSSGTLTKASADSDGTQVFMCLENYVAPASGAKKIHVYRILPTHVFKVESYADNSSTAKGALVTLHTDGLQVTATTTKGVFEILSLCGDGSAGTYVEGRFPTAAGR